MNTCTIFFSLGFPGLRKNNLKNTLKRWGKGLNKEQTKAPCLEAGLTRRPRLPGSPVEIKVWLQVPPATWKSDSNTPT